jgi:hypothetical protein
MMSSEEDTECFGLYGDKLLKKTKRTRQRVDAGEPRNSYSSIPNFSSRPSFISGGLYGAIFSQQGPNQQASSPPQQHQHFSGLFSNSNGPPPGVVSQSAVLGANPQTGVNVCNNFAPSKMLNELLGRQMKAADAASSADINMIGSAMDSSVNNSSGDSSKPMLNGVSGNLNNNTFETSATMLRNTESDSNHLHQPLVDNAHMLRDILQGRKKELLALEQELRAVSGGNGGGDSCPNNNNNEIKVEQQQVEGATGGGSTPNSPHQTQQSVGQQQEIHDASEQEEEEEEGEEMDGDEPDSDASESGKQGQSNPANNSGSQQQQSEIIMENDNSDSYHSDLTRGSNNSLVHIKEEDMMLDDDMNSPNPNSANKELKQPPTESLEIKRARVENIVSSMRSSPSLPVQVNGCKKRKLYHPQQHESARYVLDDDDDEPPALKQKRVEKDALKTQLRTMQEQLAEMQQKYVQLCNRMELESDCQDENTGDMSMEMASASAIAAAAAAAAQAEELLEKSATPTVGTASSSKDLVIFPTTPVSASANSSSTPGAGNTTPTILQTSMQISNNKPHSIISSNNPNNKLHQHAVAIHPTTIQQQQHHQVVQQQQQHQQHQHGAAAAAAGVTLNGGVPSLLHQHASAVASAAAAQHHMHQSSHAPLQNPAAAAAAAAAMYLGVGHKMFLEQEAQRLKEAVGGDHPHHPQLPPHTQHHHHPGGQPPPSAGPLPPPPQAPHHHPCPPPPHHHHHPSSHQLAVAAAAAAKNAEFSERFPFFRNGPGPITGSDLEGLAEVLKTEISASLTILIDSILSRFLQQRRFMGKQQSEAAAEQLNKDLLLASQLLDRKSPRTKVIDRGPNNSSNNPNQPGGGGSSMQSSGNPHGVSNNPGTSSSGNGLGCGSTVARVNGTAFPINLANSSTTNPNNSVTPNHMENSNSINLPPHLRPPISIASTSMFQPPKPPTNNQVAVSAAMPVMNGAPNAVGGPASSALYSMGSLAGSNPFCHINNTAPTAGGADNQTPQPTPQQRDRAEREREIPEQNEALSLVVTTKKKRHKVTDTRITPRTVSRILSQDGSGGGPQPPGTPNSSGAATPGPGGVGGIMDPKYGSLVPSTSVNTSVNNTEPRGLMSSSSSLVNECPSPRPYHPPPPPMLPVSLPTSVAIPNPGLHESQVFSPYSPFYGQHQSSSPPDRRDAESPISHPPSLLHPALLAAHGTPDYGHMRSAAGGPNSGGPVDTGDRGLDCNAADSPFDGMQPALSFSNSR